MLNCFFRLRLNSREVVLHIIGDPSPKRANFFMLEEYKRVEISRVEVKIRVRNSVVRSLKAKRV